MMANFYDLEAVDIFGRTRTMAEFKGKYLLIVNTASHCGLTHQYEGLENLFQKFKEKDLVVLGFPCNQFGMQEPGTNEDISNFCEINYHISFPLFSKINVNGQHTHPIYKYLKKSKWSILGGRINWNFTKFLVNKEGKVLKRFSPRIMPRKIEIELLKILK